MHRVRLFTIHPDDEARQTKLPVVSRNPEGYLQDLSLAGKRIGLHIHTLQGEIEEQARKLFFASPQATAAHEGNTD